MADITGIEELDEEPAFDSSSSSLSSSFSAPAPISVAAAVEPSTSSTSLENSSESPSTSTATARPAYAANRPCHWYMSGYCLRGDSCWFSHDRAVIYGAQRDTIDLSDDEEEETTTTTTASASVATITSSAVGTSAGHLNSSTRGGQNALNSNSNNTDDDDEQRCAICFEEPTTFGLLVSCNHAFCLTCIRTWRSKEVTAEFNENRPFGAENTASVTKACPNCRTPSLYVVPSSFFPTCAEQKEIIIRNYKEAAGRKKCKYFERSAEQHWCPFGDGCFFAHLDENGEPCKVNPESNPRLQQQQRQRQTARRSRPFRYGSNGRNSNTNSTSWRERQILMDALGDASASASVEDIESFRALLLQLSQLTTDLQSAQEMFHQNQQQFDHNHDHINDPDEDVDIYAWTFDDDDEYDYEDEYGYYYEA
ncbi:hypothetical protein BX616_010262 [Lobosporangium transversale]|nr:hypothetical protein BX616_010262 [Lobosporangium transversale]